MVDFAKLNDPAWREARRLEREAEEAKQAAHDTKLRAAVELCLMVDESLAERERSLVRNCRMRLNTYLQVSEPQEKWLLDIAGRTCKAQVDRFAAGDEAGEHPTYRRGAWPHAAEFNGDANAYWAWVLHQTLVHDTTLG